MIVESIIAKTNTPGSTSVQRARDFVPVVGKINRRKFQRIRPYLLASIASILSHTGSHGSSKPTTRSTPIRSSELAARNLLASLSTELLNPIVLPDNKSTAWSRPSRPSPRSTGPLAFDNSTAACCVSGCWARIYRWLGRVASCWPRRARNKARSR